MSEVFRRALELTDIVREEADRFTCSREEVVVYNPLQYARKPYELYLKRFVSTPKRVLLLGMNPGPWGMAQTGVPFGEIDAVRTWMGIEQEVEKPSFEHPKRPIEGFAVTRHEKSGQRLWALMQQRYSSAEAFFEEHAVLNYCPLVFMEPSGKNLTPDKLPLEDRRRLEDFCDRYLCGMIELLGPEFLIGVGKYAQKKLLSLKAELQLEKEPYVGWVLHPSPASPAANAGWSEAALKQLQDQGVWS